MNCLYGQRNDKSGEERTVRKKRINLNIRPQIIRHKVILFEKSTKHYWMYLILLLLLLLLLLCVHILLVLFLS